MQNFIADKNSFGLRHQIAAVLILSLILWLTNAPVFFRHAQASNVTSFSDTLGDSNLSTVSSSTLQFTLTSAIYANGNTPSMRIQFDPSGSAFSEAYSAASTSQFYIKAGATDVDIVSSCSGVNQATITSSYNNGTNEYVEFDFCSNGPDIATGTVMTVGIGPLITNPSSANSYVVRLLSGAFNANSGDTRVAVLNNVTVTATVDTSFTFTVSGMATSTTVNGTTTTFATTNTLIPFGELPQGAPATGAQRLNVATNATHGFVVTVHENQDLTDTSGDTIHLFKDGAATVAPTAWTSPSNTLGNTSTYGHFGITSSDDVQNQAGYGTYDYTGNKYSGAFFSTTTLPVFANSGPSDGLATNIGSTTVGYTIQVGSLQPAGNDYTNTIEYVATPTF